MENIGMRNIKTGIAVFLCIIILRLFHIEYPFYACIASVICMQSSISGSFTSGINRMIGTFIGALVGFLFALISPGNALLCMIGIICVIYLCNIAKVNKSVAIACIVFIAIMTNLKDITPFTYSIFRLFETFIGIVISVTVNYIFIPPNFTEPLYENSNKLVDNILKIAETKLIFNVVIDLPKLNKQILDFKVLCNSHLKERKYNKNLNHNIDESKELLDLCEKAYNHLLIINSMSSSCRINITNCTELTNLYSIQPEDQVTIYTNNEKNIVFNYHIKELINILYILKKNERLAKLSKSPIR
jgi:uncharacterized membrane protein YgaE (UPF0421/DUF939 family)